MKQLELIILYHGGDAANILEIRSYGLSYGRRFYCTRQKSLAQEAAYGYGVDGALLEILIPHKLFDYCKQAGVLEERYYLGVIQLFEGSSEVIISSKQGLDIINDCQQAHRRDDWNVLKRKYEEILMIP